jgi:DNA gyrase subunit A
VKVNKKKGVVAGAMFVTAADQVLLISNSGVVIRTRVDEISQQGRDATGVRVMNLASDDRVSAVARILDASDEIPTEDLDPVESDLADPTDTPDLVDDDPLDPDTIE